MCILSYGKTIINRLQSKPGFRSFQSLLNLLQMNEDIIKDEHSVHVLRSSTNSNSSYYYPSIKILNVVGFEERSNDLLYCPPVPGEDHPTNYSNDQIVVFFGGDMQDFHENMVNKEKTKKYIVWSLENTAKLLSMHYRNCHIIIVRPSSIEDGIFSNYSNFVPSSKYGVPHFVPNHGSLNHLLKLLGNLQIAIKNIDYKVIKTRLEDTCKELDCGHCCLPTAEEYHRDLNGCCIELVGFSKGCVVLNQFLHEFHHYKNDPGAKDVINLIDRIKAMRWLDGGHGGRDGTWVTSEEVLASYVELGKQTYVHVTPYQVRCPMRPWIRKEEEIFTEILTEKKLDIRRFLHLEEAESTLDNHFKLLSEVFPPKLK